MIDPQTSQSFQKDKELIYQDLIKEIAIKTDKLFAGLFAFEWLLGIVFALWISPNTWVGDESRVHIHIYAAVFLGGIAALYPIITVLRRPGDLYNRYVITIAQMSFSILFIHLTGGRIETHFHVFGSLAFLAFYRDWRPVILATAITAVDHLLRGIFWPASVYGTLYATPWRALEHAAWVIFEVFFLCLSMKFSLEEMRSIANKQSQLTTTLENVEKTVEERTENLILSKKLIIEQQEALISSAKMTSLGEMAGGIAHEINNPLSIIQMRTEQLEDCIQEGDLDHSFALETLATIKSTIDRVSKIVRGLRSFARDGKSDPMEMAKVLRLIEDTIDLCQERFKRHNTRLDLQVDRENALPIEIECRPIEISQVLLNLLNNAFDAIQVQEDKWVKLEMTHFDHSIEISITDCGKGIPHAAQQKIMEPFFTTKEAGKGTGLGLSISKGIIDAHNGKLYVDNSCPNTRFIISLPKRQEEFQQGKQIAYENSLPF